MVSGNGVKIFYGYPITKDLFDKLCEDLPMKYINIFTELQNKKEYTHIIGIELKLNYDNIYKIQKTKEILYIDKKELQTLIDLSSSDKIEVEYVSIMMRTKCKNYCEYPTTDKFAEIYIKVMSYGDESYNYKKLTKVDISDIEQYCKLDESDFIDKFNEKIAPTNIHVTPAFYVYGYSY